MTNLRNDLKNYILRVNKERLPKKIDQKRNGTLLEGSPNYSRGRNRSSIT